MALGEDEHVYLYICLEAHVYIYLYYVFMYIHIYIIYSVYMSSSCTCLLGTTSAWLPVRPGHRDREWQPCCSWVVGPSMIYFPLTPD